MLYIFTVSFFIFTLAFAQDSNNVALPAIVTVSTIISILFFLCCVVLGCCIRSNNSVTGRHHVVYTNSTPRYPTNISRHQRSRINAVTVSRGNTAPPRYVTNISRNQRWPINAVTVSRGSTATPAPPYTVTYTVPPAPPYTAPPDPAPPYTATYTAPPAPPYSATYTAPPAAPYAPTSVPISMLPPHEDLSADEPPAYSSPHPPSIAQQSAELVQQSEVQDQVESRTEVQIPPEIIQAVSDNSETQELETSQDPEQSLRLTNQGTPLPSDTGSELELQTETIIIEFQDNCTQEEFSTP